MHPSTVPGLMFIDAGRSCVLFFSGNDLREVFFLGTAPTLAIRNFSCYMAIEVLSTLAPYDRHMHLVRYLDTGRNSEPRVGTMLAISEHSKSTVDWGVKLGFKSLYMRALLLLRTLGLSYAARISRAKVSKNAGQTYHPCCCHAEYVLCSPC
jgi:hypothetical protein